MELSPSVYEHAAAVIHRTPWEVSRDAELTYAAHAAAYRLYHQTPIMPGIDIYNLEAEAYGGVVRQPDGVGIPAISRPIFHSAAELSDVPPLDPTRDGRIPMAIGPLLGGLFIGIWGERDGVRAAFAVALGLAAVALVLQQRLIENDPPADGAAGDVCTLTAEKNPVKLFRLMNPAMKSLLVSDILVRFCEQIPYAFVVVWCMKTIDAPVSALQFGWLTTIEMATAVLVYIPVAWMADRTAKKPFVFITFIFFTLFPLVLMFSRSFGWLVAAFVLRGLKEFGEPTRKALIMDLAPDHCKAAMFGLYYLIRDVVVSVAALGGAVLWQVSPQANLIAAAAFGAAGTVGFAVFGRDIPLRPIGGEK